MKHESILEGVALEPWRQHLLDAAAYMEEHGHLKGSCFDWYGTSSAVCVAGALFKTKRGGGCGSDIFDGEAFAKLKSHLGMQPAVWNDRPETTKDMAVAALIGTALQ